MDRAKWELLRVFVCLILPLILLGIFVVWLAVCVLAIIVGREQPTGRLPKLCAILPPSLAGPFLAMVMALMLRGRPAVPPTPPATAILQETKEVDYGIQTTQLVFVSDEAHFPAGADRIFEAYETCIPQTVTQDREVWQQDFAEFSEFFEDVIEETRAALTDPEQLGPILAKVIVKEVAIGIPVAAILAIVQWAETKARERNSDEWTRFGDAGKKVAQFFQAVPRARRVEIAEATGLDYDDLGHLLHLLPVKHSSNCFWSPLGSAQRTF